MKLNFKDGRANKVHIHVDGEYRMTVDRDFIASSRYCENIEIDEEELAELEKAVSSRRAFNKAVDLLSRRDHSRFELVTKLKQKGYTDGIDEALDKLEMYGYLDDRKFAEVYSGELVRIKHFGKRRVVQELFKKGINRDIIDEVLEELEFDEDSLVSVIERKYLRCLDDEKGVRKTVNALIRLGYSYGEIKEALSKVQENLEEEEFEE